MAFNLINPFLYTFVTPFSNTYSMSFTASSSSMLAVSAQTNNIDTALRSANPQFTISFWMKPYGNQVTGSLEGGTLFSKFIQSAAIDRNLRMHLKTDSKIYIYGSYDGNNATVQRVTTATFPTGATTWYHVAFVYDSSQTTAANIAKLYVNGSEITAWDTNVTSTTNKYFFNQSTASSRGLVRFGAAAGGGTPSAPTDFFSGRIDEATFWTTGLTSAEITSLYNSGTPADPSSLAQYSTYCTAYWRMGDSTGDTFTSNWVIADDKGSSTTNLSSSGMTAASRVTQVPPSS